MMQLTIYTVQSQERIEVEVEEDADWAVAEALSDVVEAEPEELHVRRVKGCIKVLLDEHVICRRGFIEEL